MGSGGSSLSQEDIDFLRNKSQFTEKQIRDWHKDFMRECPGGLLDRQQFRAVYDALFPGRPGAFFEHVYRSFDLDASGRIDFKEFIQGISVTQTGEPRDKLELAFRLYDVNGDGQIQCHELVQVTKALLLMAEDDLNEDELHDMAESKAGTILQRIDSNKDGRLSQDEFIDACLADAALCRQVACLGGTGPTD